MTTNEASHKFGLEAKDISKLCKNGLIPGAKKSNNRWIIPQDLNVILTKENCAFVLREILKSKNYGPNYPINHKLYATEEEFYNVMNYLYRLGFIAEYDRRRKIKIHDIQLTEEGFDLIVQKNDKESVHSFHFAVTKNIQIGLLNVNG